MGWRPIQGDPCSLFPPPSPLYVLGYTCIVMCDCKCDTYIHCMCDYLSLATSISLDGCDGVKQKENFPPGVNKAAPFHTKDLDSRLSAENVART